VNGRAVVPIGVYRTPGRSSPPERIAPPSLRTLFAPLARTALGVVVVVAAVAAWSALAPSLFLTSPGVRFVPSVDTFQDVLAIALPASVLVLLALVVQRVRPSWGGLRLRGKVAYVALVLAAQMALVVAGEAAMFFSRGGLQLFGPSHLTSRWLPDGRTAHVYTRGGLQCGYDVLVSEPLAFTATRSFTISRSTCLEPTPSVRANPDGTLDLVGPDDKPLEPQASPSFSFGLRHGC
jgi:hypothetical protein